MQTGLDAFPNCFRGAWHRERREARLWVFGRLRLDRADPLRQSFRNLLRVSRGPDARAVYAAAPAVEKHAVHHNVEILLPLVHYVVTEQNLGEARSVNLNASVASVALNRRGAAKNHRAVR